MARSKTGAFSFWAGKWPVVAISGSASRKLFFESRQLNFQDGYAALLAGAPEVKENVLAERHGVDSEWNDYLTRRLVALLKGPQLKRGLPQLLLDARQNLDAIVDSGSTDPFESIYKMIFAFTMRTVACKEIADDPKMLAKCLGYFESIQGAVTPVNVMYPWVPTLGKAMSMYQGGKLYMIIKDIVDDRKKTGRKEEDALQFLLDQNDSLLDIISFVLGSLFAGQINSGVNTAYILCYLATSDEWMTRIREEVDTIADKYHSDKSVPLKDRLMSVPLEAWDFEFPLIDLCLREVIRLQLSGTAFRKNNGPEIPINASGSEVIPNNTFVLYSMVDVHYNPDIYSNVREFDPARFLPDRAEDKKVPYGFVGWGAARHPCPGMRFAKLENTVVVAFFLAYFDEIRLSDAKGNQVNRVPDCNLNNHSSQKPVDQILLKYKLRKESAA